MSDFQKLYNGRLWSVMSWEQLDAFWKRIDPAAGWYVYAVGEPVPVVPAVATPTGFRTYLFSQVGRTLVDARCFETLPTLRASFNRITKRIQWELDYTRMPLHEQSEGIVTSLG